MIEIGFKGYSRVVIIIGSYGLIRVVDNGRADGIGNDDGWRTGRIRPANAPTSQVVAWHLSRTGVVEITADEQVIGTGGWPLHDGRGCHQRAATWIQTLVQVAPSPGLTLFRPHCLGDVIHMDPSGSLAGLGEISTDKQGIAPGGNRKNPHTVDGIRANK